MTTYTNVVITTFTLRHREDPEKNEGLRVLREAIHIKNKELTPWP